MSGPALEDLLKTAFERHRSGDAAGAAVLYDAILVRNPDHVDALRLLASARRSLGDLAGALDLYERVLQLAPDNGEIGGEIWFNFGNALVDAGRSAEAVPVYQRAVALQPGNADVAANLGIAYANGGAFALAADAYRLALSIDPTHKTSLHNLGNALGELGDPFGAVDNLRAVVRLYPDLAEAHYNLSLALLRLGDFAQGFAEYEWRWKTPGFPAVARHQAITDWDGRPFAGKRLLVHAEQGLGDTIQFVKLLPLVKSLGGGVILQVPERLVRLLRDVAGADQVICEDPSAGSVDLQVPLLGLPHRLLLTPGSIPSTVSYLAAEPELVDLWKHRLALDAGAKAIGSVWQGNPASPVERGRSLDGPLALAPFAVRPGLRLIALQKLEAERLEPAETPSGWKVAGLPFLLEHPGPDFDAGPDAFVDTAAIMASLSAMVSVCTAPLHLAGALGVPSVALLKRVPDWRWMMGRRDTPWYPGMHLCRQPDEKGFAPAIEMAADEIARLLAVQP